MSQPNEKNGMALPFRDLPADLQTLIRSVCRRCGTAEPQSGGAFVYGDETWSHVLCSPPPLADVCECGDWEAHHVLRRGACRICRDAPGGDRSPEPCLRYRYAHEEPMPPAMYAGTEQLAPASETRPRYVTLQRIAAALAALTTSAEAVDA